MQAVNRFRLLLSLFLIGTACATAPSPPSYEIYVLQDTVSLRRDGGDASFDVTVVVKNADRRDLYIDTCDPAAERQVRSSWYVVFLPACLGGNSGRLKPGDSVVRKIVERRIASNNDPNPEFVGSGSYRLIFPGAYYGKDGTEAWSPAGSVVSRSFFVKDSPSN